jgi:hypothetical protein
MHKTAPAALPTLVHPKKHKQGKHKQGKHKSVKGAKRKSRRGSVNNHAVGQVRLSVL